MKMSQGTYKDLVFHLKNFIEKPAVQEIIKSEKFLNYKKDHSETRISFDLYFKSGAQELFNQRLYAHEKLNDEHIGTALRKAFRELGVL